MCCSCSYDPEIIKIGRSSHKMYSNKILNFQECKTILNAWKLIDGTLYIWGLSSQAKEFSAAARIMQSSSKELSTLVADRVLKCKQTDAAAAVAT